MLGDMRPIALSRFSLVTSLGIGAAPTVSALREARSGLAPNRFAPAPLATYVGAVAEVDDRPLDGDDARFDCRNNRLAAMALEADGFGEAVAASRERYGGDRIGVFVGTSTAGILQTEMAYRRRDGDDSLLPADFDYARTHNIY